MSRNVTTILLFHKDCVPYDLEIISLALFKEIKNIQSPDYYICSFKPSVFPFSPVQSLSHVQLFVTPWTAVRQASLSINNFRGLFTLMSIRSVMPSKHLILCNPLFLLPSIFPSIRVFSNESALASGGPSIGVSPSTLVLPMNIQDWFTLGWTGWISLQSKGRLRVFSICSTPNIFIRSIWDWALLSSSWKVSENHLALFSPVAAKTLTISWFSPQVWM